MALNCPILTIEVSKPIYIQWDIQSFFSQQITFARAGCGWNRLDPYYTEREHKVPNWGKHAYNKYFLEILKILDLTAKLFSKTSLKNVEAQITSILELNILFFC